MGSASCRNNSQRDILADVRPLLPHYLTGGALNQLKRAYPVACWRAGTAGRSTGECAAGATLNQVGGGPPVARIEPEPGQSNRAQAEVRPLTEPVGCRLGQHRVLPSVTRGAQVDGVAGTVLIVRALDCCARPAP
jgi:hypothetical protein